MSTVKDEVRRVLDKLPDNVSLEEVMYHLYVRQKIELGLNEVKAGRTISQAEIEKRMERWLVK